MKITDKAPVGFTCPSIDSAIDIIQHVEMPEYDRYLVLDLLEELREDNAKLRECLNDILDNWKKM
jgi:hypothetical protein